MTWWLLPAGAFAQALPLPEQLACDAGTALACGVLGQAYGTGNGVPKDEFRATQLFRRGCDLGDPHSCMFLAEAYRTGIGTRVDQAQAVDLYTRACEMKNALACRSVGDLYTMGAFGLADGKSAGIWYKLACELGDAQGCTAAGLWIERGDGLMLEGTTNGLPLFEKGCAGGHHQACGLLAERYLRGSDGAVKNVATAYEWYAKGCVPPEDAVSCRETGMALLDGKLVPRDVERGLVLLDRACFHNEPAACRRLATEQLARSAWADALFSGERGCDLGDAAACRAAEKARAKLSSP